MPADNRQSWPGGDNARTKDAAFRRAAPQDKSGILGRASLTHGRKASLDRQACVFDTHDNAPFIGVHRLVTIIIAGVAG